MSDSLQSNDGLSSGVKIALTVFCILVLAYSLVIAGQILLGVLVCAFIVGLVLSYHLLNAFLRFVDSFERIADSLERIADGEGATKIGVDDADERSRSREHVEDRW